MNPDRLKNLARLAEMHKTAALGELHQLQRQVREIDEQLAGLRQLAEALIANTQSRDFGDFHAGGNWLEWKAHKEKDLYRQKTRLAPQIDQARFNARIAIGRLDVVDKLLQRQKKDRQQTATRRAFL